MTWTNWKTLEIVGTGFGIRLLGTSTSRFPKRPNNRQHYDLCPHEIILVWQENFSAMPVQLYSTYTHQNMRGVRSRTSNLSEVAVKSVMHPSLLIHKKNKKKIHTQKSEYYFIGLCSLFKNYILIAYNGWTMSNNKIKFYAFLMN